MGNSAFQFSSLCVIGIIYLSQPAYAFGAGNIGSTSAIEGQNWRHGDIEDVLLTLAASRAMSGKKFSKLDVKRVYFGNWLRDYSQAVDVGTVKFVSAKAITLLLWILGFMSFGYGTGEFEVTMERLGCYRPEDHIDNPKNYADNQDARQYDQRLRGPVNERKELAIDPETGLKAYIASENLGITTSAGHVRGLFRSCIELGRRYGRNKNKADLYEALRLLGTACHCLEDFPAHSNYTELALIEMGERNVFPHVGRDTQIRLRGARSSVYPVITGTFGGVDFLHSVTGEFDDKVTQSEIQELENTMYQAQQNQENTSMLQELLKKVPSGMFGDKNEAGKVDELKANSAAAQMQNTHISPRQPEEWTQYLDSVQKQIYPIIQFHDEIMQGITETIEKIPILPDLIENLQDQLNIFVFSLIAPYVIPIIKQIKVELNTGSSEIIESSMKEQHIVFSDDRCSDPTHSMLSKDHFSNILNEPAGKVAGQILKWVVPQIIAAWDDERIDVDRTINRVIRGTFHHPALRDYGDDGAVDGRRLMFSVVERWWHDKSEQEKDGLRDQLSRGGVESGRNHKPGVVDHGHGSGKPLGMPKAWTANSSGAPGGGLGGLLSGAAGVMGGSSGSSGGVGQMAAQAIGGGALGAIVGGLASNIGGDILGGGMDEGRQTYNRTSYGDDGSRMQTVTQVGHSAHDGSYGQAQYSRTDEPYGGRTETYDRYQQSTTSTGGWQSEVHHEERSSYGGYHEETRRYGGGSGEEQYGISAGYGGRQTQRRDEPSEPSDYMPGGFGSSDDNENRRRQQESRYGGGGYSERNEQSEYSGYARQGETSSYSSNRFNRGEEQQTYGRRKSNDSDERPSYERHKSNSSDGKPEHGRHKSNDSDDRPSYSRRKSNDSDERPSYGRRQSREREEQTSYGQHYGRQEESYGGGYGQQEESYSGAYGRRRSNDEEEESRAYGRGNEEYSSGGYSGGREDDESGYGGRRDYEEESGY